MSMARNRAPPNTMASSSAVVLRGSERLRCFRIPKLMQKPCGESFVSIVDEDPGMCLALKALMRSVGLATETFFRLKSSSNPANWRRRHAWMRLPRMSGLELQRLLASTGVRRADNIHNGPRPGGDAGGGLSALRRRRRCIERETCLEPELQFCDCASINTDSGGKLWSLRVWRLCARLSA